MRYVFELKEQRSLPKKIGTVADKMYDLKVLKSDVNKLVKAIDAQYKALEEQAYTVLREQKSTGGKGTIAQANITNEDIPVLDDKNKFLEFVMESEDNYDLVPNTPLRAAVKERWGNKETVPGVSVFHKQKLSLTKLSASKSTKAPASTKKVKNVK